jgi:hypothetical protein
MYNFSAVGHSIRTIGLKETGSVFIEVLAGVFVGVAPALFSESAGVLFAGADFSSNPAEAASNRSRNSMRACVGDLLAAS